MGERGTHLDPRLPVHRADAHRHTIRRRESWQCITGGLRSIARECCRGSLVTARLVRAIRTRSDLIDRFGDGRYLRIGKAYRGPVCRAQRETEIGMARVSFLSYFSRSDSRERYSPPGRRSLLAPLSVPDLGFVFAGGAVGRVLRFILPRRRCTMATIRVTRRRARNAMRSLGVSMGFILGQRMALDSRISREALFYPRPGWYHGMMESGAAATDGEKTGFFIRKKNQFWGYPGASCVYLL